MVGDVGHFPLFSGRRPYVVDQKFVEPVSLSSTLPGNLRPSALRLVPSVSRRGFVLLAIRARRSIMMPPRPPRWHQRNPVISLEDGTLPEPRQTRGPAKAHRSNVAGGANTAK
jgi:hypothetical protein